MARIRTIKPEAFSSESLAAVSISAERTFFGLLTQADDHGGFRDQPAVIAGLLWSLRPEHGPVGVEDDLTQLAGADLICRYEDEDGKRYLHIVTFTTHQRVNRPSGVRHPPCPHHHGGLRREPQGGLTTASVPPHGGLSEDTGKTPEGSRKRETAGERRFSDSSVRTHGGIREHAVSPPGPDLGPRNGDLGSTPLGGASAPAPDTVSVRDLVGEYVSVCAHRPPNDVLGQLSREVGKLLGEGIQPAYVRAGLERLRAKGLHPRTLPSLVNEAMNTPRPTTGHRAWANPTDVETAYGGDL
ncbi:hypothetical protein ACWGCP_02775 [Streptomyces niveus]